MRFKRAAPKLALACLGILLALALTNAALALTVPSGSTLIQRPNLSLTFNPLPQYFPGVAGDSRYTTDARGIRTLTPYDSLAPDTARILAIGGSTTQTLYLDDSETWTALLQDQLPNTWVGNVGVAGHKSIEHYFALRDFASQLDLDMVLMLVGFNDMGTIMQIPDELNVLSVAYALAHRDAQNATYRRFYQSPYLDEWALQTFYRRYVKPRKSIEAEDRTGWHYQQRREKWLTLPVEANALPATFEEALEIYADNLQRIAEEARRQAVELVLITQPSAWSVDMGDFERYLWLIQLGRVKEAGGVRYEPRLVVEAMDDYNAVLLDVCASEGLTCVDLATAMNGRLEYFYDDCHFNEAGAREVARVIGDELRRVQP